MNKSTLVLIVLATLALGALIGGKLGTEAPVTSVDSASQPVPALTVPGSSLAFRFLAPGDVEVTFSDSGRAQAVAEGENFIGRRGLMKSETLVIDIEADGRTEYKALMQQGDAIVYSWKTDGPVVYYDFHAHDDAFGEDFFTRYSQGNAATDSGAIVAAYDGEHGWYLRNRADNPVQITLQVSGFYEKIVEIDL